MREPPAAVGDRQREPGGVPQALPEPLGHAPQGGGRLDAGGRGEGEGARPGGHAGRDGNDGRRGRGRGYRLLGVVCADARTGPGPSTR